MIFLFKQGLIFYLQNVNCQGCTSSIPYGKRQYGIVLGGVTLIGSENLKFQQLAVDSALRVFIWKSQGKTPTKSLNIYHLLGCLRKLGSVVRINWLYSIYTFNWVYSCYN